MIINIGTTNPSKIEALNETIKDYPMLKNAETISVRVESGVSEQPMNLDVTIKGAKNRARNAWTEKCNLSVGIESGFIELNKEKEEYIEHTICAIFDGNNFHIGFSPAFTCPPRVMHEILKNEKDLTAACYDSGVSNNPELGKAQGIVGILTKMRKSRKEYTKDAIIMALVPIENSDLY